MRIAIDISPLSSGHKVRGTGFYLQYLLDALKKYHPEHEYIEFIGSKIPKNADIVHYPYFDPFSLTLPFFSSKAVIVTVHDLTPLVLEGLFPVGLKGMLKWRLQRLALLRASRVITDSVSSKNDIIRITGLKPSQVDAVYLAAGEQFKKIPNLKSQIPNLKKKYNLPGKFALYVGDVTPNKNILRLVQACLQTHTPLVIAGKAFTDTTIDVTHPWTKELGEIREKARSHKELIHLLGFVSDKDLGALYNAASVFVMPSLYEGFGLPVVEAFACGTPVVCSDKGSLKEIVANAAEIINPLDVADIAKGLEKVISNAAFAKDLSEKGFERAKKFSWKKTADETILSYQDALLT